MTETALPTLPAGVDPVDVKCRCADLWSHPIVRLLVGDAFRPGGVALTAELVARLGLRAGDLVLDIGSGAGATLRFLREQGLVPVGVDYSAALASEAGAQAPTAVGDAERLPFASDRFDAVLLECVLSALPDKHAAVADAQRVLRPGGRLGLSDVTSRGSFSEPLASLVSWVACTAGALEPEAYVALLEDRGLRVQEVNDHRGELRALVSKARRRLALLAGAVNTGILGGLDPGLLPGGEALPADDPDALLAAGRDLLGQLAAAVDAGELGYTTVVASA